MITSVERRLPVEIAPTVPPRDAAEASLVRAPAGRRSSQGIIEIVLGSGDRIRVEGDVDGGACVELSMLWRVDDPGSGRRASVVRDRLHG
ncbi:hypothetical protein [Bradyrhizobium sp. CCGE-LA001]|uniref:hypothetical protein n=1 Tax=Bradyrhizobium sp. CCGE-LA001 TaxID=1223566 RepID=UPI0002AACDCD|nr:hypothetical protein [Bradyrhizobium sp. CCGE-LA001]